MEEEGKKYSDGLEVVYYYHLFSLPRRHLPSILFYFLHKLADSLLTSSLVSHILWYHFSLSSSGPLLHCGIEVWVAHLHSDSWDTLMDTVETCLTSILTMCTIYYLINGVFKQEGIFTALKSTKLLLLFKKRKIILTLKINWRQATQ